MIPMPPLLKGLGCLISLSLSFLLMLLMWLCMWGGRPGGGRDVFLFVCVCVCSPSFSFQLRKFVYCDYVEMSLDLAMEALGTLIILSLSLPPSPLIFSLSPP